MSLMMMSLIHPISEEHWGHPRRNRNEVDQLTCINSGVFSVSDATDITILPILPTDEEYFKNDEVQWLNYSPNNKLIFKSD